MEEEVEKGRALARTFLAEGKKDRAALVLAAVKRRREALLQVEQSKTKVSSLWPIQPGPVHVTAALRLTPPPIGAWPRP